MTLMVDTISGVVGAGKLLLVISGDRPRSDFVEWVARSTGCDRSEVISEARRVLPRVRPATADVVVVMKDTVGHSVHGQVDRAYVGCKILRLVRKKAVTERLLRQARFTPVAWDLEKTNGRVAAAVEVADAATAKEAHEVSKAKARSEKGPANPVYMLRRRLPAVSVQDVVWLRQHERFPAIRSISVLRLSNARLPATGRVCSDTELRSAAYAVEREVPCAESAERGRRFLVVARLAKRYVEERRTPSAVECAWVVNYSRHMHPVLVAGLEGVLWEAVVLSARPFGPKGGKGSGAFWCETLRSVAREVPPVVPKTPEALEVPEVSEVPEVLEVPEAVSFGAALARSATSMSRSDLAWLRQQGELKALRAVPWVGLVNELSISNRGRRGRGTTDERLLQAAFGLFKDDPMPESPALARRFRAVRHLADWMKGQGAAPARGSGGRALATVFSNAYDRASLVGVFSEAAVLADVRVVPGTRFDCSLPVALERALAAADASVRGEDVAVLTTGSEKVMEAMAVPALVPALAWQIPAGLLEPMRVLKAAMQACAVSKVVLTREGDCEVTPDTVLKVKV